MPQTCRVEQRTIVVNRRGAIHNLIATISVNITHSNTVSSLPKGRATLTRNARSIGLIGLADHIA